MAATDDRDDHFKRRSRNRGGGFDGFSKDEDDRELNIESESNVETDDDHDQSEFEENSDKSRFSEDDTPLEEEVVDSAETEEEQITQEFGQEYSTDFPGWRDLPRTLVISCCDGRFATAKNEFLTQGLRLSVFDEVTVPGGPVSITFDGNMFFAIEDFVKILAKAHPLERVIGIFHYDCAYYKAKFPKLDEVGILDKQKEHVKQFKERIRGILKEAHVECYYACEGHNRDQAKFQEMLIE